VKFELADEIEQHIQQMRNFKLPYPQIIAKKVITIG